MASNLDGVGCIVSSDLRRASSTAEIIAETLGAEPVIIDEGWRERDVGRWQGLTTDQIESQYPGALAAGDYPPGWESNESLLGRVLAAIHRDRGQGGIGRCAGCVTCWCYLYT